MKHINNCNAYRSFTLIVALFTLLNAIAWSQDVYGATSFTYAFSTNGTLEEATTATKSSSPYFWLKSGGLMVIVNGVGATNQGSLPATNKWYIAYAASRPVQTDNGAHPQNVFKMFTRSTWQNVRHSLLFNITADNLSNVVNRHPYDGVFLLDRYDSTNDNYYMMGFRTDGASVLKKKVGGKFYTLQYTPYFFVGDDTGDYDTTLHYNMLPKNRWIAIRSEVRNNPDGTVDLKFFYDPGGYGWILAGFATDDGVTYGPVLNGTGLTGIQSDFMDVQYDNYALQSL